MNQLPCPGCQQVYPVPPHLPPNTPFTCKRCGFASTLGALAQAQQQQAFGQQQAQQQAQQAAGAAHAQQGDIDAMQNLPGHGAQAPGRPLANMPVVKPSGVPSGGLDLADGAAPAAARPPPPQQPKPQQGGGMAVIQPNRSKTDQHGNVIPDNDVVCPKCRAQTKVPPDTDMDFAFRCSGCGHSDRLGNVLLSADSDPSPKKKAKGGTGDFFDDVPEELSQPTEAMLISEQGRKKDPRLPAIGAALGILLLIGIPVFTSEPPEFDPREGVQVPTSMSTKAIGFGAVCLIVAGGLWFLLRPQEEDEEEEEEEEE